MRYSVSPHNLIYRSLHIVNIALQTYSEKPTLVWICRVNTADLNVAITGGDPISLPGNIVLCSRDAILDDRHFTGQLAHLSLWSSTLTASHVASLYNVVPLSGQEISPPASATPSNPLSQYSSNSSLQVSIASRGCTSLCPKLKISTAPAYVSCRP